MLEKVIGIEDGLIICEFPKSSCGDVEVEKEVVINQLVNAGIIKAYSWINKNTKVGAERNRVVKAFRLWKDCELNEKTNPLKTTEEVAKFIMATEMYKRGIKEAS